GGLERASGRKGGFRRGRGWPRSGWRRSWRARRRMQRSNAGRISSFRRASTGVRACGRLPARSHWRGGGDGAGAKQEGDAILREIVLDTETTGLDPLAGHRIVEIACLELFDHIPTGRSYQCYVNPERDVPIDAQDVHGLTLEFLSDKPFFAQVADELLAFIDGAPLVIHNAEFDIRFLNAELQRLQRSPLGSERIVDTLQIARQKFPGAAVG